MESGRYRRAWAKRKGSIKRQGFKRHSRHEGRRPSAIAKGPKPFEPFAGEFYAGHRIDRPVFFREVPVLVPVPGS